MARQKGSIGIEGSLGKFSFYSSVYGDIIRRKGGASKTMIRKSPRFKSLREHQLEFSACAAAGKLFRQGLITHTKLAPDHTLVWRVTKLMNQLKDQDLISGRGKRTVAAGLKSKAGKDLMQGFELNSQAPLSKILKRSVEFNDGKVMISRLVPKRDLLVPKAATHVEFTAIVSRLDFSSEKHLKDQTSILFKLDNKSRNLSLQPILPKSGAFVIAVLQVHFLKEVNGEMHLLENKKTNSLTVICVE